MNEYKEADDEVENILDSFVETDSNEDAVLSESEVIESFEEYGESAEDARAKFAETDSNSKTITNKSHLFLHTIDSFQVTEKSAMKSSGMPTLKMTLPTILMKLIQMMIMPSL